jgi:hypothetical protein
MNFQKTLLAAAAALVTVSSHATLATYTGDTTGGPTFNRPLEDLTALSGLGTAVSYDVVPIIVSLSGTYSFVTTGVFDTFTLLYSPSFDPATPLNNALVASDDLLGFNVSGFTQTLTAGTTYFHVVTGFGNANFGAFSVTIGGPGVITVVPEPSTYAMMGLGLLAVGGLIARRRRQD